MTSDDFKKLAAVTINEWLADDNNDGRFLEGTYDLHALRDAFADLLERVQRESLAEVKHWEKIANEWMADYDKLKAKYEPLVGIVSDNIRIAPVEKTSDELRIEIDAIFEAAEKKARGETP